MLALDIETMGLMHEIPLPAVTCACLYDGVTKIKLPFICVTEEERAANAATLLRLLDEADILAGYNAVKFDLEYIRRYFGASEDQLQAWVSKCVDPYMLLEYVLRRRYTKLNAVLALNSMGQKTGSGGNAITLAREGKVQDLLDYCMMDAELTWRLCTLPSIRLTNRHHVSLTPDGFWSFRADSLPKPPANPLPPVDLHRMYAADCCGWTFDEEQQA